MKRVAGASPMPRYGHVKLLAVLLLAVVFNAACWMLMHWKTEVDIQPSHSLRAQAELATKRRAILEENCTQPAAPVKEKLLGHWACTLLRDSCLDQSRILIHTGQKSPGHTNWTSKLLFKTAPVQGYVLPGYPEPLGFHYKPATWNLDIRAPTPLDPEDVWQPTSFNNCSVPLIFWTPYFSIYSIFLLWRVSYFHKMLSEGLFDRSVLYTPHSHGMELPAYYQTHLEPFTRNKVESLSSLSSRERVHEGRSRCYSQMLLCNFKDWERSYKKVARSIVEYYKDEHPQKFPPAKDGIFRVAFFKRTGGMRKILNLDEVMKKCNQWKLPQGSKFTSVKCYLLDDFAPDKLVDSLAQLQRVHALVSSHGSGMANAFFLPNNSAVVEVMCYSFCGYWPDRFYKWGMETDHTVNSGYFRLRADKDHCFPGKFEKKKTGSKVAYHRDKDLKVEFETLAKVLNKIALGDVYSTKENFPSRVFNMTRGDIC